MSELLQQVKVIDPVAGIDQIADVLIKDGYIQEIAPHIIQFSPDTTLRNCQGLVLGPGLVDLYSYSGVPGFEERETLISLLQAAAAGGFTRLNILPNTSPPIDNPALVAQLQQNSQIDRILSPSPLVQIWGGITMQLAGKQLTELTDLYAAGVVGFTDNQPWENLAIVRRVLEYLHPFGKPVAWTLCDNSLRANGVIREGAAALRLGLPSIPAIAETTALAALLELVADIDTPIHIMRVSTARSVELIARAKSQGLPITASTTWMHILLDTKALNNYPTSLRLDPPLGNPEDVAMLRQGVRTGVIDAIAIDHAPYTFEEKVQAFAEAPAGAIGLEIALPLLWQNLVETEEFQPQELWRALSTSPLSCLQQKTQAMVKGAKAELTLLDPQKTWLVDRENLHTLSSNTFWFGQEIQGKVIQIWC